MGRRYNYPCSICKKNINLKIIKANEIMWDLDNDEIAHKTCLPENYNEERWYTSDEMRDCADLSELS